MHILIWLFLPSGHALSYPWVDVFSSLLFFSYFMCDLGQGLGCVPSCNVLIILIVMSYDKKVFHVSPSYPPALKSFISSSVMFPAI